MSQKIVHQVGKEPQKGSALKNMILKVFAKGRKGGEKVQEGIDKGRTFVGRTTGYEQHIAVFGESGSGKTTLLSVFYGKQQSARFIDETGYELLAKDGTQGNQLLSLYNKVRDNLIMTNVLRSTRYEFSVRPALREKKGKDIIRLVWHDYPGEWLNEQKFGKEDERKKDLLENLIRADVAYFLVDAQKLKEDGGKYLKRLFANFKDVLSRMCNDYASQGKLPLHYFPRLWYICLSKADLLPDWTVQRFKSELEVANEEIANVERVLEGFVREKKTVDFKSGYLLLSSLRVNPDTLKVENWEETKGVDAIVPLSFFTPIFRAFKWAKIKGAGSGALKYVFKVGGDLFSSLGTLAGSGAFVIMNIPFVGKFMASSLAIAAGLLSAAGFLLKIIGSGAEKVYEKQVAKFKGLKFMIGRFQLKIIEIRNATICEIKDIEEYIAHRQ